MTPDARPLTPPEALLLRQPGQSDGREALPAAVRYLLAAGLLGATPQEERRWWGTRRRLCMAVPERPPTGTPHLDRLLEALGTAAHNSPCPTVSQLMYHLQQHFGVGFHRYAAVVRGDLAGRGLLQRSERRVMRRFRRSRWERTPEGEAAHLVLEGRLADARTIPELLDHDPARAAAVAAGLGGLLLAVEELRPHYSRLADALRAHGRGETGTSFAVDAGGLAGEAAGGWDLALDTLTDVDWDGTLDALDAAFDGFEGGFDGGAGGDGGGGE